LKQTALREFASTRGFKGLNDWVGGQGNRQGNRQLVKTAVLRPRVENLAFETQKYHTEIWEHY